MNGIIITPLKQIKDDRGKVMHFMRSDWDIYQSFGEVYFTTINAGHIKGWKKHTKMIQNLVCINGNVKLVLYDDCEKSNTKGCIETIYFGDENYCLVTIHPEIWVSFTSLNNESAIIANCASILHDPSESLSLPIKNEYIPFNWGCRDA